MQTAAIIALVVFAIVALSALMLIVAIRGSTTEISGGALLPLDPLQQGNLLQFHFEYAGGGGCRVLAISEEAFSPQQLSLTCCRKAFLFVVDRFGRVVDHHIGEEAFGSRDLRDWNAMRHSVEGYWRSIH